MQQHDRIKFSNFYPSGIPFQVLLDWVKKIRLWAVRDTVLKGVCFFMTAYLLGLIYSYNQCVLLYSKEVWSQAFCSNTLSPFEFPDNTIFIK